MPYGAIVFIVIAVGLAAIPLIVEIIRPSGPPPALGAPAFPNRARKDA